MKRLLIMSTEMKYHPAFNVNHVLFLWYKHSTKKSTTNVRSLKNGTNEYHIIRKERPKGESLSSRVLDISATEYLNNLQ